MIRIVLLLSVLAHSQKCLSQLSTVRGEFADQPNGLMYSDTDIKSLRFVVDSLNLRFKKCELNKTYKACKQVDALRVVFQSTNNDLTELKKDLQKNIPFQQLVNKYKSFQKGEFSHDIYVVDQDQNLLGGNPGDGYDETNMDFDNDLDENNPVGKWAFQYYPKASKSDYHKLVCTYFPGEWRTPSIPTEYGRLIQYVDCMIDTASSIFLEKPAMYGRYEKMGPYIFPTEKSLVQYINWKMNAAKISNDSLLNDRHVLYAVTNLKDDQEFKNLVGHTIDKFLTQQREHTQLESLALQLKLFDKALLLKRNYRVMGFCSMDSRPREHAREIAILAAQSHSWNIFLRAHLDIMNDRFERITDGSYAWKGRKTYLKELEELNLDIVDLMLGLSLRASNTATNHYYGTIWRLGWALTESRYREQFEQKATRMINDKRLDKFNRGVIFLLYQTYLLNLDKDESERKINRLKADASSFPDFIQPSIKKLQLKSERQR